MPELDEKPYFGMVSPHLREVQVNRVEEARCWDLFVQERSHLLAYVKRLAPPGCDGIDIVQEVGLRLLCQPDTSMIKDRLSAWCKSVARHIVLHELRAARYERAKLAALDVRRNVDAWEPERRAAIRSTLVRELARLDPISRELLLRRYVLEQTSDEIARVTGLSSAAVRMRLMRARAALGAELRMNRRPAKTNRRTRRRRSNPPTESIRAADAVTANGGWEPRRLSLVCLSALGVGEPLSP